MARRATLAIPSEGALIEADGGYTSTPGTGPVGFIFAGGGNEVPLFERDTRLTGVWALRAPTPQPTPQGEREL